MRIAYFTKQIALQSEPVWQNFLGSCKRFGIEPVENSWDADCALIWSVLWRGRMEENRKVYEFYRNLNKPVFILEVGSLLRGKTWKVSINNITRDGEYANTDNFIANRDKNLGIILEDFKYDAHNPILIAGQHDQSLQWKLPIKNKNWIMNLIKEIRNFSNEIIHVRPHPRNFFNENLGKNVIIQNPIKIPNTFDIYDLKFNYRAIINFNSGVSVQSAQHGIPTICDESSLASEVSSTLGNLEKPPPIDRHLWWQKILHTEWTVEEIAQGIPLERLLSKVDLT